MNHPRVETPAGQNWSCHGCTECCRGKFIVTLSAAEKERIEQQGWTTAEGVDPAAMFEPQGDRYRLAHQSDGACVFLDSSGRCRIHARFGEAAKPMTCRLYPLVIHPAGKKLMVSVRFSCPSAAANRGQPMREQTGDFQKLARLVVTEDFLKRPPPPIVATASDEWTDALRFVRWIEVTLAEKQTPIALKLLRVLHWLGAVERGKLDQIVGPSAEEILEALVSSAGKKLPGMPPDRVRPSAFGRFFLRLMVLEHARLITVKEMDTAARYRWRILGAIWQFARPGGRTPALRDGLARVRFADIEGNFESLTPGVEAMLTRYFQVKVQGLHFCGHAFHGRPLIEGFRNLALMFPVIVWLSRWLALSDGRSQLTDADVTRAIAMVDDHYNYSPYLSWRVKLLHQRNDIVRLCGWYGRGSFNSVV